MKIWHVSDTHGYHDLLDIPKDIDMVITTGDCSNQRNPYENEAEVRRFLTWYDNLNIKHKVYIAGNHDTSIERGLITKDNFTSCGIVYLFNEFTLIEGIKIWGSPHCPSFGNWAFMKQRGKLHDVWQSIPTDTDIVAVHTPPKGMLDLSYSREGELERCGCNALRSRMLAIEPELCLFGHIHNGEDILNAGTMTLSGRKTIYSNGSVVTDGKFGRLSSNGNILTINKTS